MEKRVLNSERKDRLNFSTYTKAAIVNLRGRFAKLLNKALNRIGYVLVRTYNSQHTVVQKSGRPHYAYDNLQLLDVLSPWLVDQPFLRIWNHVAFHTLTDIYRSYELYQCVRETANIAGDIIEVGVWRGGTGAVLAAAAQRWKPLAKVWLCDTFEGVVKAGDDDPSYVGGEHADTSSELVNKLMQTVSLNNVVIIKGIFPEDSGAMLADVRISLCHVDVDVYQSAADTVAWVIPRIEKGGMLIFDDYGFSTCQGITKFVDELRCTNDWIYFYNLNKHAVLIRR